MVSVEESGVEFLFEADQEFDHAFGIGTPVDVVSHENEVVFGLGIDEVDHLSEGIEAAVDIADDKSSHGFRDGLAQDLVGVKPGCQECDTVGRLFD